MVRKWDGSFRSGRGREEHPFFTTVTIVPRTEMLRRYSLRGYFKNLVILGFKEIEDIDQAMLLKQKELYVDREHAIPLEEGEYYLVDVIGSTAVDEDGNVLGTMTDYLESAAQLIYIIHTEDGKDVLVPAVDEFIREVNVEEKRMVIHTIPGLF